jgi:hypothetical protein
LKTVTTKVDVALSKASQAASAEKFLLDDIENLGKAMKCKTFGALDLLLFQLTVCDHLFLFYCRRMP